MKPYRQKDIEIFHKQISKLSTKKKIKVLELGCSNNRTLSFMKKHFPNAEFYGTEWDGWKGKFKKPKDLK